MYIFVDIKAHGISAKKPSPTRMCKRQALDNVRESKKTCISQNLLTKFARPHTVLSSELLSTSSITVTSPNPPAKIIASPKTHGIVTPKSVIATKQLVQSVPYSKQLLDDIVQMFDTKFDNLKNNFDARLDRLDTKVDECIATVAGMQAEQKKNDTSFNGR